MEYSAAIGLLVYPCGGDFRHWGNTSWSSATDIYRDLAGLWSGYGNVIGVDITNEASDALKPPLSEYGYNQPEPAIELLTELGGIVHDAGVPMTHSRSIHSRDGWLDEYAADHLGDFLDFHVYYSPDVGDSLVTAGTRWGEGKKLIVGEFGKNVSTASIDRVEYYDDVRAMCANDENCLGAFAWAAWDQGDLDSAKYGLFDQERNLRIDIGGQLKGFPVRRS